MNGWIELVCGSLSSSLPMAIEVQCPNGHRLKCPDERAGMRGKCPKCGAAFEVPKLNGKAAGDSALDDEAGERSPETSQVTASSDSGKRRLSDLAAESKITFLCPNGHKLSGPASLQGHPGQCPHCSSKFIIPRLDEEIEEDEEEEPLEEELEIAPSDDSAATEGEDDFLGEDELEEVEQGSGFGSAPSVTDDYLPPPPPAELDHPLANLFVTLWQEHEHGGKIEVHLANGVTIVPDWWAPALSGHSHGVFAIQSVDGNYVMETVAWDAIQRITISRIQELPGGIFE